MAGTEQAIDRGDEFDPFADLPDEEPTNEKAAAPEADTADAETLEADAATEEDDTVADEPDKGHLIPKDRFDQAVKKERSEKEQLAARLKEYEQREAQRNTAVDMQKSMGEVKKLVKEHTNYIADGELDKASEVMESILNLQAEMADARSTSAANNAKNSAKSEMQYDSTVARLEATYPAINPDSPDFDSAAVRRVQAYMTGLVQNERMSPNKALQEAVETLLTKAEETPALAPAAPDTGMRRKEAAVNKALKASNQQPPSTASLGLDHDKEGGALDASAIAKMSWDEFVKLPEDKLVQMRGDFV